jgi:hypothetical protein
MNFDSFSLYSKWTDNGGRKEEMYHTKLYRLLTGVTLPLSFRKVGVGVLLFAFACSTNLAYIT